MTETSLRRKRLAADEGDEQDEHDASPHKRTRAGSGAAFKWLWSPPLSASPAPESLWTYSDRSDRERRLFRGPDDGDVPRSFSLPPEPTTYRRYRRRGAISVTASSPPGEVDRHLAAQLEQQIAIIRLKSAAAAAAAGTDDEEELERVRRELEGVQIDATLPSILGISLDFGRKLDLGPSGSPDEGSRNKGESVAREPLISSPSSKKPGSPAGAGGCLWDPKKGKLGDGDNLRPVGCGAVVRVSGGVCGGTGGEGPTAGLWRREKRRRPRT
ncbi:hypothetical protein CMUS01_03107 [Colletotrichum musicola]|uniref:Uncharacterized protein n=1 Tax=Colletotrichum musicola TaxID=2175873 RepID=A0A8H6NTM1_9PEZI|nr:hypothetical protein CMUS01_03107 [Colletotrichum musicola]